MIVIIVILDFYYDVIGGICEKFWIVFNIICIFEKYLCVFVLNIMFEIVVYFVCSWGVLDGNGIEILVEI